MTSLSIIIPAHNDLHGVLTVLNSLRAFAASSEHEYIVQDDASPLIDLRAFVPPCAARVERNAQNMGFAGNCNAGAARSTGDILVFVNQDVYGQLNFSEGWDTYLLAAFDNPQVAICGVKLVFPDGRLQHAGGVFDGHCQPTHRYLGYADHRYPPANISESVPWVTGAALAIRKSVFDALKGFDPAYLGGYFEDVDLCAKVASMGLLIWYEPRAQLVHKVGTSGGSPHFAHNARVFKSRWVDPGYIEPDISAVKERFW